MAVAVAITEHAEGMCFLAAPTCEFTKDAEILMCGSEAFALATVQPASIVIACNCVLCVYKKKRKKDV